jgi:sulfide dehydrogenase cytochrome subunit
MKNLWTTAALVLAAAGAHAQTPDALYIKSLAATCANCHGTDGRAVNGSSVPTIAGMPREYLAHPAQGIQGRHPPRHRDAPAQQGLQ